LTLFRTSALLLLLVTLTGCTTFKEPPAPWPKQLLGRTAYMNDRAIYYATSSSAAREVDHALSQASADFALRADLPATPGVVIVIDKGDKLLPDDWRDPKIAEAELDDAMSSILSWALDDTKLKQIADDPSPAGPTWIVVVPTDRLTDSYVSALTDQLTGDQPFFARVLTRRVTRYAEDELRGSIQSLRRIVLFGALALRNPALDPGQGHSLLTDYTSETAQSTARRIRQQIERIRIN
jgi:hypothetical protein